MVDLITEAFRDLNIIEDSETPTAAQISSAVFKLNGIVTALQATGVHVWTEEEAILFLQPNVARYALGGPGVNAPCCDAYSFAQTTLAASAAADATQVTLTSATGVSDGDNIGIVLDDGSTFWTLVSGAPVAAVATLADALSGSASSGNVVVDFAPDAQISRPLKVPAARLYTFQNMSETSTGDMMARQQYMDTPNKLSPGTPTQCFYDPQRDTGYFFIWPVPVMCAWAIRFTWYRSIQDFLDLDNTMDFPREWSAPLRWLLNDELKIGYSVPPAKAAMIEKKAAEMIDIVSNWDREAAPIQFGMDYQS